MDYLRLVRNSHIFASAVRDILETRLIRAVCPYPLTLSQFHLLKLMAYDGEHHIGDIAALLGVSNPAATKNIDKLVRHGLVVRTPAPDDRRATVLSVSLAGRRIVVNYEELKSAQLYPLLDRFTAGELEAFADILERLSLTLLDLDPESGGPCLRCAAYFSADCRVGETRGGCPFIKDRVTVSGKGIPT
ncbi:MAG: MarR family transcriptional regulator [Actinobacteria bacterium]|nr:MAG: MarR family transcriptional regulator [Actinomycetota bacterium]